MVSRHQAKGQAKGRATKSARSNLRWQKARDISDSGGTKADAMTATGLTLDGLNSLLRNRTGSQQWPIQAA